MDIEMILEIGLIIVDGICIVMTDSKIVKVSGVIAITFIAASFIGR